MGLRTASWTPAPSAESFVHRPDRLIVGIARPAQARLAELRSIAGKRLLSNLRLVNVGAAGALLDVLHDSASGSSDSLAIGLVMLNRPGLDGDLWLSHFGD